MARNRRSRRPKVASNVVLNDPLDDLFQNGRYEVSPEDMENIRAEFADKATRRAEDPWAAEEVAPDDVEVGQPNLLKTSEAALAFMLAGNARVTFKSKATGNRFTYRIRGSEGGDVHFVAVLRGSDNDSDYAYLGRISRGIFWAGRKVPKAGDVARDAPSAKAFKWVWEQLQKGKQPGNVLEIWHEGRCGRCGRTLTVPSSIASGIGPECASKMGGM